MRKVLPSIPLGKISERKEKADPKVHAGEPFIGLDDIEAHTMRLLGYKDAGDLKSSAKKFYKGDVLYSRLRPYLNKVWVADREGLCSSEFIVFYQPDLVDPKFLAYRLNSSDFVAFANSLDTGDRPRVNYKQISVFNIPSISVENQERIVSKIEELFSELDNGIAALKTVREQLKVYRQAILKHAFEGKLTEQWREENQDKLESPQQLLARIQQEREARYQQQLDKWKKAVKEWEAGGKEGKKPGKPNKTRTAVIVRKNEHELLPELPLGWCWLRIGALCDVVRGGSPRPAGDKRFYDGDIPFLKVADLTRTEGLYVSSSMYTIKADGLPKTRSVPSNTLLISNSGATLGVPKICTIPATFNDGIAAFLGLDKRELKYHYYFWSSKTAHLRAINQGAAQPNLNTDLIKDEAIPVCHPDEMAVVAERIEKIISTCDTFSFDIKRELSRVETLRQSILKKAFSGLLVIDNYNADMRKTKESNQGGSAC